MPEVNWWNVGLLALAGLIAVSALARLMLDRRSELVAGLNRQVEEQRRRQKAEQAARRQQERQSKRKGNNELKRAA